MAEISVPTVSETEKILQNRNGGLLVRWVGILIAVIFGVTGISLLPTGSLLFSTLAGVWAGTNFTWAIVIALVFCLFQAFTYAAMGIAAPHSGADYYLTTRAFSRPLGFISSWVLVIASALLVGALMTTAAQSILPVTFQIFGVVLENANLLDMVSTVSSPQGVVWVGTLLILAAFLLNLLPPKIIRRALFVGFVLTFVAWGILFYQLGTASATGFSDAWDKIMGAGSFIAQIDRALALGMATNPNPQTVVMAGLMLGFFIFFGYYVSTYFAGEVIRPGRTLMIGSSISLVVAGGIFLGATLLLYRLIPLNWLAAESYLFRAGQQNAAPWVALYAAAVRPNLVLISIVMVSWVYALVNMAQVYFFFISRILLAWADDGLLPVGVGFITPRFQNPLTAGLLAGIVAEIGMTVSALVVPAGKPLNYAFLIVAAQLIPVFTVSFLPFAQRAWFERLPRLARVKIGPLPLVTLTGAITLLGMLWFLISSTFFTPGLNSPALYIILVIFALSGTIWYYVRVMILRRKGVDLTEIFRIPEES